MAKRTVIAADEELVVKGKLTITGNVYQVETTQTVNRLESDELVINANQDNVNSILRMYKGSNDATITFDGTSLALSVPVSLDGGNISGNIDGTATNAHALTSAVTLTADGDMSGTTSFINAGDTPTITLTLDTVNSNTGSYGNASTIPSFTVNSKGLITAASEAPVSIVSSQVTNFTSSARSAISHVDNGGDGSLSYNSSTGVITYTGPSASEVRAHLSQGTGISYASATGVISTNDSQIVHDNLSGFVANEHIDHTSVTISAGDGLSGGGTIAANRSFAVDSTVVRTSGNQSIGGNKTFTGTTTVSADIVPSAANTYNLGSWANHFDNVFANVLHAERLDLGDADLSDVHATFYAGTPTGTILDTNTAGGLTYAHNAPSSTNPGGYYRVNPGDGLEISGNAVAVNSTVVRTSGNQSLAGTKTFTGTIIVPTQAQTDNSTKAASTAYVRTAISNLIDGAPATLDTLNELANALNDDASIGSIVTNNTARIGTLEGRELFAGAGLTGGGTLDADRTFNIGQGAGITVNADSIEINTTFIDSTVDSHLTGGAGINYTTGTIDVDSTVVRTSGAQTIGGIKTFTDRLRITSDGAPYGEISYQELPGNWSDGLMVASGNVVLAAMENLTFYAGSLRIGHDSTTAYTLPMADGTANHVLATDGSGQLSFQERVDLTTNQVISGNKVFTGELVIPQGTAQSNGAIYYDSSTSQAFIKINGSQLEITPSSLVGDVEDVGTTGINLYAGFREIPGSSATVTQSFQGVSVHGNSNVSLSASNPITFTGTTELYDTDDFFTPGNTRITVPANSTLAYAEIFAQPHLLSRNPSYTRYTWLHHKIVRNGTDIVAFEREQDARTLGTDQGLMHGLSYLSTGPIQVSPGDYFEYIIETDSTSSWGGSPTLYIDGNYTKFGLQGILSTPSVAASKIHGIKSLATGTYASISESANVITIDGDITNIRGAFNTSNVSGYGGLNYTSSTGVISYTGVSDAEIRGAISNTGLITYNTSTGVIGTNADNYGSWKFTTSSAGNVNINSGDLLTFQGSSGVSVTHSGSTITIAGLSADITSVAAGSGLTGGGSAGDVTLNIGDGYGITVNADSIETNNTHIRALFDADGDLSYNPSTGVVSFTERTDAEVNTLIDNRVTQTFVNALNIDADKLDGQDSTYYANATNITSGTLSSNRLPDLAVSDFAGSAIQTSAETFSDSDTVLMTAAAIADKIESYGYSTTTGDITGVTAGTGLSGGGTTGSVTLNVSELTTSEIAAGSLLTSSEAFSDSDTQLMTAAAIDDRILSYGYSTTTGTVTSVTGGSGLTGTITSSGSLAVGAGSYILVGTDDVSVDATSANTASKVVARDTNGSFAANVITATATTALYADLAEKYATDAEYPVGTVVVFGGDAEVTECKEHNSYKVAGVISTDPAYMMNSEAEGQYVALRGRVPCKVIGKVRKGDVLITSDVPGHAMVTDQPHFVGAACIVGKAISSKDDDAPGVVEILV